MSAILQAANTINPGTVSVNSSASINEDINVNDLIPAKPYYVYYGTLPYDSCGGNYYYAVFTDTISAVGPISNLVASGIATVPMASKTNLQKSNGPPTTGFGNGDDDGQAEEYVLYQVVDDESCPNPKPKGKSITADDSADDSAEKSLGINAIFGIMIAALIIGVAYLFWNWNVVKTAAATAVAAASNAVSAVAGSPGPSAPSLENIESSDSNNSGNMSTGQLIFILMISIIGGMFMAYINAMRYNMNK
jgi:hypothetical protein